MESHAIASYQTPSGQKVEIIKQSFSSFRKWPAKRISFVSGLHGNELEGIYVCHLLISYLKELKKNSPDAFQGEVNIYPVVNPQAVATGTRLWPFFKVDMNRQFGGENSNSLPEQLTTALIDDIKSSSDVVVDFHASNLHLKEAPQIRIIDGMHKKLIPLAVKCNVDLIWVHPASQIFQSTLGYNLNQSKIPTLIVETGIALRINQIFVNRLFEGMLNLLHHIGTIVSNNFHLEVNYPIIVNPSQVTLLKAEYAGLFVRYADIKSNINKGETIGKLVSATNGEVLQVVTAPINGFLFTIREHPLVYPGALLARIAQKDID